MSLVLLHVFLLVLCLPAALAAPSLQKRSFKLDRIRNPHFRHRNGPRQLLNTYRKYRMPIPQDLLDALGEAEDGADVDEQAAPANTRRLAHTGAGPAAGRVAAIPANQGVEYISPIRVGGQTVSVALDSGSADLWVFSTRLPLHARAGHRVYDPSLSPAFRPLPGANFSILYGDGTGASGIVGTDTVDVGGAVVRNQAVQMATSVSAAFVRDANLDGLLGLAFSKLNTVKPARQKTFFENVMPSLAEPLFTADLPRDAVGAYEFGRIDHSRFAAPLAWVPADTSGGFWQVSTRGFRAARSPTRLPAAQAVVDTGTTLMLVSREFADGYYSQVPGAQRTAAAGGVTFPCNTTLPDLFLDVGGVYTARIRGSDINFGPLGGGSCFGGIQRSTSRLQIWGDIFFRSQFVVFHGGNHTLGMASRP